MSGVSRQRIVFTGPEAVEVREETIGDPGAGKVRVRTIYSAMSPGTERLVYLGNLPEGIAADSTIEALQNESLEYPLSYGYACVGSVEGIGPEVDPNWREQRVFAFQPHVSRFLAKPSALIPLPSAVETTDAVMIPSVETAVNLVMDGRPMVGEKVVVFGQGVVGLLATALLARHPLTDLLTVEPSTVRRCLSLQLGATETFDPEKDQSTLYKRLGAQSQEAKEVRDGYDGADLVYELSGQPSVLNEAFRCAGFRGRIVVGSWYGSKSAPIDLGGRFHRSRMELISSQVSTINPSYRGRWSKDRRLQTVIHLLNELNPSRLITHQFHVSEAAEAYRKLTTEEEMVQTVFGYD